MHSLSAKVNEHFYEAYFYGNHNGRYFQTQEEREDAVEEYKNHSLFDPNYGEGVFYSEAAGNGDMELLEWLINKSPSLSDAKIGLLEAMKTLALSGQHTNLSLCMDLGGNPEDLKRYSVYGDPKVKEIIDNKIKDRKR